MTLEAARPGPEHPGHEYQQLRSRNASDVAVEKAILDTTDVVARGRRQHRADARHRPGHRQGHHRAAQLPHRRRLRAPPGHTVTAEALDTPRCSRMSDLQAGSTPTWTPPAVARRHRHVRRRATQRWPPATSSVPRSMVAGPVLGPDTDPGAAGLRGPAADSFRTTAACPWRASPPGAPAEHGADAPWWPDPTTNEAARGLHALGQTLTSTTEWAIEDVGAARPGHGVYRNPSRR
ncbi:hypothetical protein QJS66_02430 [Kocuria rhizophila]|nr:hypothetical protein QJS66_02430 [Kocuria rhizophila]